MQILEINERPAWYTTGRRLKLLHHNRVVVTKLTARAAPSPPCTSRSVDDRPRIAATPPGGRSLSA
jgi:hypothetical protein